MICFLQKYYMNNYFFYNLLTFEKLLRKIKQNK